MMFDSIIANRASVCCPTKIESIETMNLFQRANNRNHSISIPIFLRGTNHLPRTARHHLHIRLIQSLSIPQPIPETKHEELSPKPIIPHWLRITNHDKEVLSSCQCNIGLFVSDISKDTHPTLDIMIDKCWVGSS